MFWVFAPCAWVTSSRRFEGTYGYYLHDFSGFHNYRFIMVTTELDLFVTSRWFVFVPWKQNGSLSTTGLQNSLSYA